MPISKKPRSKAALRTSTKPSARAALPDRRTMEGFLAGIAGHRGDDATAKAQDVMYEAWERTTSRSRIALARKPPVISDDGYVTMGGPDEATDYVTECGAAWHRTPGAVVWLTKLAATLGPKRRTRAAAH
jgi:hypothetical protein